MSYVILENHSEEALAHYGVLGMKWGVRRYQNADGSYTKRGLERYSKSQNKYNDANENLKRAKENARSGIGNRSEIRTARQAQTAAKKQLEKDYKQLKLDNLADQGRKLYASGRTITGGRIKLVGSEMAVMTVSKMANSVFATSGRAIITKYGAIPVSKIASSAIAIGGTAANAALAIQNARDNKRLRAYYAHIRK